MAEKNRSPSRAQPWTFFIPDEAIKPRGSDNFIIEAVSRLRPSTPHGQPSRRSDENVSELEEFFLVGELAEYYLSRQQHYDNALRPAELVRTLQDLESQSQSLAKCIASLDDLTLGELNSVGGNSALGKRANLSGLPALCHERGSDGDWVDRLEALAASASAAAEKVSRRFGSSFPPFVDRGGNTNVLTNFGWNPRESLANAGLMVFDFVAPEPATSYEGGPFHLFLNDVFEYATGLEAETEAKMVYWIKKAVKGRSKLQKQMALSWDVANKVAFFRQVTSAS